MTKHSGPWLGLLVHHTATAPTLTVNQVRAIHLKKGWGDVGYHFLIQKGADGSYYLKPGRSTEYNGAHCDAGDYNKTWLGLAVIGNYETGPISAPCWEQLVPSCCHILKKYGLKMLRGHREAKATACPGKYINLDRLRTACSERLGYKITK